MRICHQEMQQYHQIHIYFLNQDFCISLLYSASLSGSIHYFIGTSLFISSSQLQNHIDLTWLKSSKISQMSCLVSFNKYSLTASVTLPALFLNCWSYQIFDHSPIPSWYMIFKYLTLLGNRCSIKLSYCSLS